MLNHMGLLMWLNLGLSICLQGPGILCDCTETSDSSGDQQKCESSGKRIWQICKEINLEILLETVSYLLGRDSNTLYTR